MSPPGVVGPPRCSGAETATARTPLYPAGLTPHALDTATRVLRVHARHQAD
ncbi:hypothetical protein [Streptomonospora alba]|uniref:hypothetical protein n=1 Tax=Streptomonospora alba TaxID=183763 RepID=UPI0012EE4439|nr:hypothetical protein [Streptomonospora alba]